MKLISMSVWGNRLMYWEGVLANAQLYQSIYPGWQLRIYTDAENGFTQLMEEYGCEVKIMENLGGIHGMFWRFLPVSEPGLEAVIIRDADSRLDLREAAAVAAWLESGKAAHVMRDHPYHFNWPMLGGLWGIRGGVIADIENKIVNWGRWGKKFDDQQFLGEVIWPLIADDCVQHTSGYSRWGGEPFPPHEPCDSDYVGQVYFEGGAKDRRSVADMAHTDSRGRRRALQVQDGGPRHSITPEWELLLTCVKMRPAREDEAAIRQMLGDGVDWTLFARKAIDHGLAAIAGHTLARVAADLVPDDILDAFRLNLDQTRRKNRALFDELADVIEALAKEGVDAIPFKGPILAIQGYGDLGLRTFGNLEFFVRDSDMAATMATLLGLGYERKEALTEGQTEMIRRLQGKDFVYRKAAGIGVVPHTRLTPIKMALDIDYAGLWRRAQRLNLNGRTMLTLAPEDDLLILAIHGGKEMWWNIRWACDVAAFIGSHPKLDWIAIAERARSQGCLRMVLLATSLARKYFNVTVPDAIAAAERADPIIEPMVQRIMARWLADEPVRPPSNTTLSMDRLRLHDGVVRPIRYVARTLFWYCLNWGINIFDSRKERRTNQ